MTETLVSVKVDLTREQLERLTAFAAKNGTDVGSVVRSIIDLADLDGTAPELPDVPVLTVPEVAAYMRVNKATVYQWIDEGLIPHRRLTSKRVVIPRDAFMKWFDSGVAGGK